MARPKFVDLGDIDDVEATSAASVAEAETFAITVGGTFVGTYSIQVSMDGTTWVNHPDATDQTAPLVLSVTNNHYAQVRVNCTAHTSGTLKNLLGKRDADVK